MDQNSKKVPHLHSLCSCLRSFIDRNPPSDRIVALQSSLLSDFQTLRPKNDDSQALLSLQSIDFALTFALRIHQEAMNLLGEEKEEGGEEEEGDDGKQAKKEYLDDSVDFLEVCNGLTAKISELQTHHLLIKHALHLFNGSKENLERARVSLKEWLDSVRIYRQIELESYGLLLTTLCNRLLSHNTEAEKAPCDFSYFCYSAKVVAVFACVLLALAITRTDRFPEINISSTPHFPWSSGMELIQTTKEQATVRFSQGYSLPLIELGKVETSVKQMLLFLDTVFGHGQRFSFTEEESKIASLAMELKQASDSLSKGLDSVAKNLSELFHAVITNRSALLDQLMNTQDPWFW